MSRRKQMEHEKQMDWAQSQRKNYKRGFLSADQRKQLEAIKGWTWTTPGHIQQMYTAMQVMYDGTVKPLEIVNMVPYGLPGNYKMTLDMTLDKNHSIVMIVKEDRIVKHFDSQGKCAKPGCNCQVLHNKVIVQ